MANTQDKIDRHPERRYQAKLKEYKEIRLAEMKADGTNKILKLSKRLDMIQKEFDKSPDNPKNQVSASYNASKEDMEEIRQNERAKIESRLGQ